MTALPDFDGLLAWEPLQAWISEQSEIPGSGPVTAVEQLTGGSQNNIFLLTRAGASFVLRRPPQHLRANSNATMMREARVLAALDGTDVPHPTFYAATDDDAIIGCAFYLMEPIDGFTPMGELPGQYATDVEWRRALSFELVDGAAALGAVDPDAVGLADFGKSDNWVERQVGRWKSQLDGYSQFENYGAPDLPGVNEIGAWLDANRPAESKIGIIHGDYQFANVMFARDEPRLAAAVDWELSSLGDPLLDLAWILQSWSEPTDPEGRAALLSPWDGMPSRGELVAHYAEVSGRDVSAMPWFFVLACYKLGILLEGSYARACAGKANVAMGDILHDVARWVFALGEQQMRKADG